MSLPISDVAKQAALEIRLYYGMEWTEDEFTEDSAPIIQTAMNEHAKQWREVATGIANKAFHSSACGYTSGPCICGLTAALAKLESLTNTKE